MIGYIHFDVKPINFLVDLEGRIKLADFGLTKKQGFITDDIEGDSVYLAKEILETNNLSQITYKSDMFSLGLTLLELLFKIQLPQSGIMWTKLRNGEFQLNNDILKNANFIVENEMLMIIDALLNPNPEIRPSASNIILLIPQLSFRADNLRNGIYKRTLNPREIISQQQNIETNSPIKRTDSHQFYYK